MPGAPRLKSTRHQSCTSVAEDMRRPMPLCHWCTRQDVQAAPDGSRELTAEEKDAGLGSVFKRDDERLAKMRNEVRCLRWTHTYCIASLRAFGTAHAFERCTRA